MRKCLTRLITAIAITILAASCASFGPTSPNFSILDPEYSGPSEASFAVAQSILNNIASQNDLLARELGKLPELQDGIDQGDLEALRVIRTVYQEHPKEFDAAFAEMYNVGKPEVRRYCSPLQAVYWLAEDGYLQYDDTVMRRYSLQRLLELGWSECKGLSAGNLLTIIHGYKDPEYKDAWLDDFSETPVDEMREYVLGDYQLAPEKFTEETRRYIKDLLKRISGKSSSHERWTDFKIVVARLNAPELLWFWIDNNLTYKRGYTKTPSQVFKTEEAQCVSSALFGKLILDRAGYKTFLRHVAWGNWANESHAGAGIITDDGRYILVVDFGPRAKPISEPYDTIAELDEVLAGRRKIVRRMWGTYFKPGD